MKKLKKFEEYLFVNKNDLGNNWSSDYHINIKKGKKPYVKKNEIFTEVDINKTIPKDAIWLLPETATELNNIGEQLLKLKEKQKNILDKQ